jgi:hypothetical protein
LPDDAASAATVDAPGSADVEVLQRAAQYPLRPDAAKFEPTVQMRPGEKRRLALTVRRLQNSSGRTRLIVKAIAGTTYLRHEIDIALPGIESIRLLADGPPGSWQATAQGLVLHPWPNRRTEYRLRMINESGRDRVVDVAWLALNQRPTVTIPRSLLPGESADDLLQQLGPTRELIRYDETALPADRAIDMPFPKPPEKDEPFPANQNLATGVAWLGGEEAEDDAPPAPSVRHGILIMARDREAGQVLLRLIAFRPQRPQRYLRTRVDYNLARERIEIHVSPRDPSLVPPEGILVRCEFPQPLPPGTEAQIEGIIGAPNYEAELFVHVPPETRRMFPFALTADGFPRAFSYRVPCWSSLKDVAEASDQLTARILSPEPGTAFAAPAELLPIRLEVDAPQGAFENGRDVVEIGIDADRDREFRDEPTWKLYSDRQAEILLPAVGAGGRIEFAAQVGDFELRIPGSGYLNQRVNLLARVQAGNAEQWSEPVEIVLDAEPPRTLRVGLEPAGVAPMGETLLVSVVAGDEQLSGVAKVEVGFDIESNGRFSDELPPLPATRNEEGVWQVELPVDAPLELGPTTVLVRASDRVGNQSELTKVDVVVATPEQAEMLQQKATNRVSGFVRYGGLALADAEVVLLDETDAVYATRRTDERGHFVFPEVLLGIYRLKVRGLARNRPRLYEATLEVAAPPAKPLQLNIDLR